MRVASVPVENNNPLVEKYLKNFSDVRHLFAYDPYDFSSFASRQEAITQDYHTDRSKLVRTLTKYNRHLNCGTKTLENLQKLEEKGTAVIITGQQAGVLTGPLYTIYKTISVIQLASQITADTGIPTVPVFWVAAEDHDFAEVDHVDVIGRDQKPVRLKLDYTPSGKLSIGQIPVTQAVFALIDRLAAETNPSQWKDQIIEQIQEAARQAGSLADWFALIMSWLFREYGLILVDPLNSELRSLWSGTFASFLEKNTLVNEKLQVGIEKVRALGYIPQVEKSAENINMFLYVHGERLPLLKTADQFTLRGRSDKYSLTELLEIAKHSPDLFSPNVVLRPVAQDVLLPIMAYVAGPGEISYYSLYREIYPIFGQKMPIIYPRANVTILEKAVAKNMDRYGLAFADGFHGLRKKLQETLDSEDSIGIDKIFAEYGSDIEILFQKLVARVSEIDTDLSTHGRESLHRIVHQIEHFQKKTRQYHRKSCDLIIKRFETMESSLYPRGSMQERVLNLFPYLFKYGSELIDELLKLPLLENHDHKLVYLGE